jgi:SAM-dependent methyltransferase
MKLINDFKIFLRNRLLLLRNPSQTAIDTRAFSAIKFISENLPDIGEPFTILDLGCAGGPTNAWTMNWTSYRWVGIDASPSAIKKLKPTIPEKSNLLLGYVYSSKYCVHNLPDDLPKFEVSELLESNSYDFVKIDIDGCDLHLLKGILDSQSSKSISGIEIEVTYSPLRNSEVNFHQCASLLIDQGFELVAIESARRYSCGSLGSPYVWGIEAQTAMGAVFQANQVWLRRSSSVDYRSTLVASLILAAYGLSDWSWGNLQQAHKAGILSDSEIGWINLKNLFLPTFLGRLTPEEYDRELSRNFSYNLRFKDWQIQSQVRETEQPWFLSN